MATAPKTGASFARGASKQDYATPQNFIQAVERRWGHISFDLAAHAKNTKAKRWFGPGGLAPDSLVEKWGDILRPGGKQNLWLNPPFNDIRPWARKCAEVTPHLKLIGARLLFLVPAAVGSNWFADCVFGVAPVFFLRPRLSFDGKNSYPKDLMLVAYGAAVSTFECWRWFTGDETIDCAKAAVDMLGGR